MSARGPLPPSQHTLRPHAGHGGSPCNSMPTDCAWAIQERGPETKQTQNHCLGLVPSTLLWGPSWTPTKVSIPSRCGVTLLLLYRSLHPSQRLSLVPACLRPVGGFGSFQHPPFSFHWALTVACPSFQWNTAFGLWLFYFVPGPLCWDPHAPHLWQTSPGPLTPGCLPRVQGVGHLLLTSGSS